MPYPAFNSGETLLASDMNAVGAWLIKSTTIGTGVSSVEMTSAFSSSYDNYLIVMRYVVSSAANPGLYVTLGATATNYYGVTAYWAYDASGDGTAKRNNGTEWNWGYFGANNTSGVWYLINPNNANRTSYTGTFAGDLYNGTSSGMLANNTQFTSIKFAPSTGTLTGGTIRIYGLRN